MSRDARRVLPYGARSTAAAKGTRGRNSHRKTASPGRAAGDVAGELGRRVRQKDEKPALPKTSVNGHEAHYRIRVVRCGKPRCGKCPHAYYQYLVWREGGRVREKYLGKVSPRAWR